MGSEQAWLELIIGTIYCLMDPQRQTQHARISFLLTFFRLRNLLFTSRQTAGHVDRSQNKRSKFTPPTRTALLSGSRGVNCSTLLQLGKHQSHSGQATQ